MREKPDFNGPSRELSEHRAAPGVAGNLDDEQVYCVNCGTIFVRANGRDCPSCTNAAAIEDLEQRLDELDEDLPDHLSQISERLTDLQNRLNEIRGNTRVVREVAEEQEDES